MLHIPPSLLTRIASGRFADFDSARWDEMPQLLAKRMKLRARKEQLQGQLMEELFIAIQQMHDPVQQNALLQLKRAIFNDRTFSPRALQVMEGLDADCRANILQYQLVKLQLEEGEQTFEREYQARLLQARAHLQGLSHHEALSKGLALSSKVLLGQLPVYQSTSPDQLRKRELQNELSVLRYLTRMYFKTSPFSTFTVVGLATPSDLPQGIQLPRGELAVEGSVRLNNYLLAYLKTLLTLQPSLRHSLPLRVNPSVRAYEGNYHFLLNFYNVEAFQKLSGQALLDVVMEVLALYGGEIVLNQLVQTLASDYVEAEPEALQSFLLKLVEMGLLEFQLGGSGTDPDWDLALIQELARFSDSSIASETMTMLKNLRRIGNEYAGAKAQSRSQLLETAHQIFEQGCARLLATIGLSLDELRQDATYQERFLQQYDTTSPFTIQPYLQANFTPQMLYYEDVACQQETQLDEAALKDWLQELTYFLNQTAYWDRFHEERQKMADHFVTHYGEQASVHLLDFYQSYYQSVKKNEKEKREKQSTAGLTTPAEATTSSHQQTRQAWFAHFSALLREELTEYRTTACITQSVLEKVSARMTGYTTNGQPSRAMGAFVQFFMEPSHTSEPFLRGVVNSLFIGMGRSSGRFLHLFDKEVTETFRRWNRQVHDEEDLVAELSDASYFNANLHPPLLPYQITLPGGHAGLPSEQCIPAAELEVTYHADHRRVSLIHTPSRKRVFPYDVCLQAFSTRSELYQLLTYFGHSRQYSFAPLIEAVFQLYQTSFTAQVNPLPGVSRYPRIELGKSIVIQRQCWYVKKDALPFREKNESDGLYFLRLNEWRTQLDLPEEVFICVNPTPLPTTNPTPATAGRDDYKPQYIHFTNPLLVRLLEKQLDKVPDVLRLEEMLPDTQTLRKQQTDYVNEVLVEWYDLSSQVHTAHAPDEIAMQK